MMKLNSLRTLVACSLLLGSVGSTGCSGIQTQYISESRWLEEEAPLGGEALAQRKQDLERAVRDMTAFHSTMSSLIDRRDSSGLVIFDDFVVSYLVRHLDPLLSADWQSSHPEVMGTDANLRFIKADILVQMHHPRRVQGVIEEIELRYHGRDGMLIGYPIGEQRTLSDALSILKNRKWGG